MFRSITMILSVFALVASIHASTASAQSGRQVRDHRKKSSSSKPLIRDHRGDVGGDVLPPINDPPPPSTGIGDYSGSFSGKTRIDMREFRREPTTVSSLNMKSQLDLAWLALRGKIDSQIRFFFEKAPRDHRDRVTLESIAGRNLYDLQIQLADTSRTSMAIGVAMQAKSVELRYAVPDNVLKFKAEIDNFFDPTITIRSTMTVVVKMTTNGDAANPLKVEDAYVELSNVRASIDGNVVHDALEGFLEFIKGRDFERDIANAINGQRQDIKSDVVTGIGLVNQKLAQYSGVGVVLTPGFDRTKSELVLMFTRTLQGTDVVDAVQLTR